jgi:hypothetical protein
MVYRNWFWGLGHSFLWCVCPVNQPLQLLDVTHLDKIGSMKVTFMHSTCSWHPHLEPEVKLLMLHENELVNSPPTLTGVGHQWTVSTSIGCKQWLSPAKPTLKVPHVGRNRSLVVRTSKCGWAIRYIRVPPSETSNKIRGNNPATFWQLCKCAGNFLFTIYKKLQSRYRVYTIPRYDYNTSKDVTPLSHLTLPNNQSIF